VVAEGSQLPEVYQKLGDLYQQAGYDSKKAAQSYAAAMQLAQESEDLKAAADAQVALAGIASNYGQTETAKDLLMQAQSNYEALGNAEQAGAVEEQIALLPEDSASTSEMPTMRGGNDSEPDIREMITPNNRNAPICNIFSSC
jgi:tetratricopeptide (TPR) repeat protein